ncbi:hypothetical protein ACFE04_030777 [Oxalis oulophora]
MSLKFVCVQNDFQGPLAVLVNYGNFMHGLMKENIQLNRKVLSEISMYEPYSFKALVDTSHQAFPGNKNVVLPTRNATANISSTPPIESMDDIKPALDDYTEFLNVEVEHLYPNHVDVNRKGPDHQIEEKASYEVPLESELRNLGPEGLPGDEKSEISEENGRAKRLKTDHSKEEDYVKVETVEASTDALTVPTQPTSPQYPEYTVEELLEVGGSIPHNPYYWDFSEYTVEEQLEIGGGRWEPAEFDLGDVYSLFGSS